MNFPDAVKKGFKNYINFKGRASRSEFWWFYLGLLILAVLIKYLSNLLEVGTDLESLILAPAYLSASARRLHDINKSGWYQLVALIPLIGAIIMLIWLCTKSDSEENKYGPVPE